MKGYLLLANGQLYEGTLMGAAKPVMAELVFTTAMTAEQLPLPRQAR